MSESIRVNGIMQQFIVANELGCIGRAIPNPALHSFALLDAWVSDFDSSFELTILWSCCYSISIHESYHMFVLCHTLLAELYMDVEYLPNLVVFSNNFHVVLC